MGYSEGTKLYNNRALIFAHAYNTAATGYAAGDLVGTKITFEDVIQTDYGGGAIISAVVTNKMDQKSALDLLVFQEDLDSGTGAGTNWSTGNDAALAVASSDIVNCIGHISIGTGDYSDAGACAVANVSANLPFSIKSRKLYGLLVARGAMDMTSGSTDDILVGIGVERDAP